MSEVLDALRRAQKAQEAYDRRNNVQLSMDFREALEAFECARCGDGDALRAGESCAYCGLEIVT